MKKLISLFAMMLIVMHLIPAGAATIYDIEFDTCYYAGQYKVGADMPEGEYVLIVDIASDIAYFCVSEDANGDNIVFNDLFERNSVITVLNGEYLELSRCFAVPFDDFYKVARIGTNTTDAMFVVGRDIKPGEYKLVANNDVYGYYCIYKDSRQDEIISNDLFDNSTYVTVKNGQYLLISRCKIITN